MSEAIWSEAIWDVIWSVDHIDDRLPATGAAMAWDRNQGMTESTKENEWEGPT